ncbi:hypothetical protein I7I53_10913 [Histoplasma capsulatum var. duboisii H88]|uniref:Uncharacterized protein n=1 Tax=Ajellomyces capsulatus (strain H88) TaxID=544711 RepID=A0A8A1L9H8_AJEC8|nr:hypothetical protein I7I53_10913 [Histoplasma capsulatum var. duboisii H88]
MGSPGTPHILGENGKCKASEHSETPTLKHQMSSAFQIMVENPQTSTEICWFSDVVDGSAGDEDLYTRNLIWEIKEDLTWG